MANEALADGTQIGVRNILIHLDKQLDLNDPDAVQTYITNKKNMKTGKPVSTAYKLQLAIAYWHYAKHYNIPYEIPNYQPEERMPN